MFNSVCSFWIALLALFLSAAQAAHADYSQHPSAIALIDELVAEEGFERSDLVSLLSRAEKKDSIIAAMQRPAEKALTWGEYRQIFLKPSRINNGVEFWQSNQAVLDAVEAEYGVPAEIVVAIIGVETLYGGNMGSYRVIDALSTLAFDYPARSPFFTSELKHFFILTREHQKDPLEFVGSYAGAMGLGQFMPSSYRAYASNYDSDPFIDIWTVPEDAIWSVANYLSAHGWVPNAPVTLRARVSSGFDREMLDTELEPRSTIEQIAQAGITPLMELPTDALATVMELQGEAGSEYWIGLQNFYAITRYNHSKLYAMAVFQLAREIERQHRAL